MDSPPYFSWCWSPCSPKDFYNFLWLGMSLIPISRFCWILILCLYSCSKSFLMSTQLRINGSFSWSVFFSITSQTAHTSTTWSLEELTWRSHYQMYWISLFFLKTLNHFCYWRFRCLTIAWAPFSFNNVQTSFIYHLFILFCHPRLLLLMILFFLGQSDLALSCFLLAQWNSTLGCTLENTKALVPFLKLLIKLVWCGTWT